MNAKWNYNQAIFTFYDAWFEGFALIEGKTTQNDVLRPAWQSLLDDLQLLGEDDSHGTLRWCLRLDNAVLDLDLSSETLRQRIAIDLANKRIMVEWKTLLWDFIKAETRLQRLMDQASVKCGSCPLRCQTLTCQQNREVSSFTFSHLEDCLRFLRRERLRAALDLNSVDYRLLNWEINMLRPLFGRPRYDKASTEFAALERDEDDATVILSLLRKEASMSSDEIAYLEQLSKDRLSMERDLATMTAAFGDWKRMLFGVNVRNNGANSLPRISLNAAAWSDDVRAQEEERIGMWRSQRTTIGQLASLFNGSMEAMSLPEDAFDWSESDL
jgi:hypothetical protein